MSINFYEQVKFTRPLTLQDCGSPILLTVSPAYWSATASEKATDWKMNLGSEYQDFMSQMARVFTS